MTIAIIYKHQHHHHQNCFVVTNTVINNYYDHLHENHEQFFIETFMILTIIIICNTQIRNSVMLIFSYPHLQRRSSSVRTTIEQLPLHFKLQQLFDSYIYHHCYQLLNPKMAGGSIWLPCGFSKTVSSKERVKP